MPESSRSIFLLHGEDEYGIALRLAEFESSLGDPANAALNITRLNGDSFQPDQLLSVAAAMPFLASRRLVIVTGVLSRLTRVPTQEAVIEAPVEGKPVEVQVSGDASNRDKTADVKKVAREQIDKEKLTAAQRKFVDLISKIPSTTTLLLIEILPPHLTKTEQKKFDLGWFKKETEKRSIAIKIESFDLPKGVDWTRRLQAMARSSGGQISPAAAQLLYSLLNGDVRLADQEIQKLLAYVNYQRQIEVEDIQAVTEDVGQGSIFALVEALGDRNGRQALSMLRRLMENQDDQAIFGMIVRQFRLLILTRAMLDMGRSRAEITKHLKVADFVVDRLFEQLRRFSTADLDRIYHRLLEIDEQVKKSQISRDLAMQTFVTALALR